VTNLNSKKCTECNLDYLSKYSYCTECGQLLKDINHCLGCKALLIKNSKFCAECGLRISEREFANKSEKNFKIESKLPIRNEDWIILLWSILIVSFTYSNYMIEILGPDSLNLFSLVEMFMIFALAKNNKKLYRISLLMLMGKQVLFFIYYLNMNNFSFNTMFWPIFVFYFVFNPFLIYIYKVNNFNSRKESNIYDPIHPKRLVVTKILWFGFSVVFFWQLIIAILSNGYVLDISEYTLINLLWNGFMFVVFILMKNVFRINEK
jgi:hypothetical protein